MDSRLRGRPERPRFVPTSSAPVEDAGLFDFYGDAMFGFDNYDGTESDDASAAAAEQATTNGRPTTVFQNQERSLTSGFCRICDGQDAAGCASQSAGEL